LVSDITHSTKQGAPKLFITGENVRHDFYDRNYAISFDLGVADPNHFRMPYWMEMVDWSEDGVTGNQNPRYGRLLNIDKLMQPLGNAFLSRPQKVAILRLTSVSQDAPSFMPSNSILKWFSTANLLTKISRITCKVGLLNMMNCKKSHSTYAPKMGCTQAITLKKFLKHLWLAAYL